MKQMKTLTVNGVTYAVTDPTAPRIDDTVLGDAPWSAKKIVDTLCPSFTESGNIITCEPVEGYPLEVTADAEATAITRCGKNLLDLNEGDIGEITFIGSNGNTNTYYGHAFLLPPGSYVLKAYPASTSTEGYIYGVVSTLDGEYLQHWRPVYGPTLQELPATFTQWVIFYIYEAAFKPVTDYTASQAFASLQKWHIQLEVGSAATDYEPYSGETFAPGDTIPALAGINTVFADTGEVAVTGRSYPWGGGADGV